MKQTLGDRWIQYIQHQISQTQRPVWEIFFIFLALLWTWFFILDIQAGFVNYTHLTFVVVYLSLALLYFERRKFAHIIREKDQHIQRLEARLSDQDKG